MAILQLEEIRPGLVAYLDPKILVEYGIPVRSSSDAVHPFVCVDVTTDGHATWVMLTSQPWRDKRLLPHEYKSGGYPSWASKDTYISNVVIEGPIHAFQEASRDSEMSQTGKRHAVTEDGLQFIRDRLFIRSTSK